MSSVSNWLRNIELLQLNYEAMYIFLTKAEESDSIQKG